MPSPCRYRARESHCMAEVVETGRRFGHFHAGGNFAPGALNGSSGTLEVGGAPDTGALPARLVALEKPAIEREGDGRDEDSQCREARRGLGRISWCITLE